MPTLKERYRTHTVRTRVKNGARWLDENFPGWEKRIDIDTLDLSNGENCICGQVFHKQARKSRTDDVYDGYSYANAHLFAEANSWIDALVGMEAQKRKRGRKTVWGMDYTQDQKFRERADRVSQALGFRSAHPWDGDSVRVSYNELQQEWVRLLKKRAKEEASK